MSKQHFELIARVLRGANRHQAVDPSFREGWHAAVSAVSVRFAEELAATNPRFDRARFVAACMGEDSTDSAGRRVRYSVEA